jgi:ubiquitin-protein ligase
MNSIGGSQALSPRVRRLKLDYELLSNRFRGWPLIQISGTAGMPPEVYRITYHIRGLYVATNGDIVEREEHVMEVNLSLGYPRRPPHCRMTTPIFHPNFDASSVCIGDFWAASEGLDDLIVRVGRMIAYQEFNTKSPLNGLAAKWAAQRATMLPVDTREVAPPSSAPPIAQAPAPITAPTTEIKEESSSPGDPWEGKIVIG